MQLLKINTPFIRDQAAQKSFEALKKVLFAAPLLHPLDYTNEFILYLSTSYSIRVNLEWGMSQRWLRYSTWFGNMVYYSPWYFSMVSVANGIW